SWRPGGLATQGSALLGWMALRAGVQIATVFLLATELGAAAYGQFVVVVAVASFLTPFAGLGLAGMVLRNGARDPSGAPAYLALALKWWRWTLAPCTVAGLL